MSEFDYVKPIQPLQTENFTFQNLLDSMRNAEEEHPAFVASIYGDPGTHKTTNAMKIAQRITPVDKKIVYVYTAAGYTSLMNDARLMERVKLMNYVSYEQIKKLAEGLKAQLGPFASIGTVIFDEYNRMFDMDLHKTTSGRAKDINEQKPPLRDKQNRIVYKDPDTPDWPDYNTAKVRLNDLMNDVLQTPQVNFIFVNHARFQKKNAQIEPDFPQQSSGAFMGVIHSLYYARRTDSGTVELMANGDSGIMAKNRIKGVRPITTVKEIIDCYLKWGVSDNDLPPQAEKISEGTDTVPKLDPPVEEPSSETTASVSNSTTSNIESGETEIFQPEVEVPEIPEESIATATNAASNVDELANLLG